MIDDDDDDDIDAGFDDRYNAAMSPAAHHYPSALQTATMYNLATGRMLVRIPPSLSLLLLNLSRILKKLAMYFMFTV
jgi:hypothetical protein